MNDKWLEIVMELMSQLIITVYSKEENNNQELPANSTIIEENMEKSGI